MTFIALIAARVVAGAKILCVRHPYEYTLDTLQEQRGTVVMWFLRVNHDRCICAHRSYIRTKRMRGVDRWLCAHGVSFFVWCVYDILMLMCREPWMTPTHKIYTTSQSISDNSKLLVWCDFLSSTFVLFCNMNNIIHNSLTNRNCLKLTEWNSHDRDTIHSYPVTVDSWPACYALSTDTSVGGIPYSFRLKMFGSILREHTHSVRNI